jgi:hypothetical protein
MVRTFTPLLIGAFFVFFPISGWGAEPLDLSWKDSEPRPSLPIGKWKVEFANGVTELCNVEKNGSASVIDPVRIDGKAVVNGNSVLMLFENGRVQRWTAVGNRFVVEHWFPGSAFPTATVGVMGIAERPQ